MIVNFRKFLRLTLGLFLTAAFIVAGTMTANAAVGPGGSVITCGIYADYPHASNHVSGTINAVGRVECDGLVNEIYLKVTLAKSNGYLSSTTQDRFYPTGGRLSGNAAKSCAEAPGTFQTRVNAVVHFPAGYTPTPQVGNQNSAWFALACGVAFKAGATAPSSQPLYTIVARKL
ncbi:hypothetical protein [Arthrobacter dokdonensis]|uniref:hypothetical protein n=1 Tax=Arthrobacter dokdonellae TaxID=2211210 RepID=UPI001013CF5C|nr:hypothetical protein [Arthrobacter dokdonellae]